MGGVQNPQYDATFVFDNDFATLKPSTPIDRFDRDGLLIAESEPGICRVICFSPKHNLTLANMEPVSYTHLDVYKRQAQDRRAAFRDCC